jgi:hypothetical protein
MLRLSYRMTLKVSWISCKDEQENSVWCPFATFDLSAIKQTGIAGVYAIWLEGKPGRYVRVGQGIIADRILAHRSDETIRTYRGFGVLRVTWAMVSESSRDGVERFLADKCNPLVGELHPRVEPIEVNLPGQS